MVFEIPVSVLKIPKFNRIKIKILPNNPKAVDKKFYWVLYIYVCSLYFLGLGILTALFQSTHLKVATRVCCELIVGETGCMLQSFEPRCFDLTALKPFISNWRQDRT